MERSRWTTLAGVALVLAATSATAPAQTIDVVRAAQAAQVDKIAQSSPPPDARSPMVKPPDPASGPIGSTNPDNMPIKRPDKPTHDNMSRQPPASGANAK